MPNEERQEANAQPPPGTPSSQDGRVLAQSESAGPQCQRKTSRHDLPTRPIEWLQFGVSVVLAVIAIGALRVYNSQLHAMRSQLAEMTAARKTSIAQIRANLRREPPQITPWTSDNSPAGTGKPIAYWAISPKWTDGGSTDAIDYRGWFDVIPVHHLPGHLLTGADCPAPQVPMPPAASIVVQAGREIAQFGKKLSSDDVAMAKSEKGYILMVGHVEYRDIFFPDTPIHSDDWCVAIIPNDPATNLWSLPTLKEVVN